MLVARMGVVPGARAGLGCRVKDADPAWNAAVDLIEPTLTAHASRATFAASDDAHWRARVGQEPGDWYLERGADGRQALQRRQGLVVLDLAQVPGIQPRPIRHLREGEPAIAAPPPHGSADARALN